MTIWRWLLPGLVAGWLLSGFYIVRGDEQAVVRRFGRVVTLAEGAPRLVRSGLHIDLPWPLSRVSRVKLNQVRTLSVGLAEADIPDESCFLQPLGEAARSSFLTGDRNILNLQVTAHYRVSAEGAARFLFDSRDPEGWLRMLVESAATSLIARSGVDYVHPLGLTELRTLLTEEVRRHAVEANLGVVIDEVSIGAVYPPLRVKAYFLDVSNARADYEKYIHSARAYEEQKLAAGRAEAARFRDEAHATAQQELAAAAGAADRFRSLTAPFARRQPPGGFTRDPARNTARQMALRRMYFDTVQEILTRVRSKVVLESGRPVDLTIQADPRQ